MCELNGFVNTLLLSNAAMFYRRIILNIFRFRQNQTGFAKKKMESTTGMKDYRTPTRDQKREKK